MTIVSQLDFLREKRQHPPRVLIVSPHPDDEVIGAGSRLPFLKAMVVQVTNGAPAQMEDAQGAGYGCRDSYARARHRELLEALSLCGLHKVIELHIADQGAASRLTLLTRKIQQVIDVFRPEYILTVPYEGGHPDHDATAFAVHHACARPSSPRVIEMLSYHNENGRCVMDRFLGEDDEVLTISLSREEIAFKRRLFDCFRSQAGVLQWFPMAIEKFRFAPNYDFTEPPHPGQLYYEMFPWGLNSVRWCELAKHAPRSEEELVA
jgi:LmbE family N-acetylglucosaminyl deacetylase